MAIFKDEDSIKKKIIEKWKELSVLDDLQINNPLDIVNMTLPKEILPPFSIEVNNTTNIVNGKLNWKISDSGYTLLSCDEPYCVRVIKSGWDNKYYVIDEDGEIGDFTISYKTKEEIENEYKIKL